MLDEEWPMHRNAIEAWLHDSNWDVQGRPWRSLRAD
jgi:hypothetical protein